MSVFRNVRIYPHHGSRAATITWDLAAGTEDGDVFVAFSTTGTSGSWKALNPEAAVPSEAGMYQDTALNLNSGDAEGFYRLMLRTDSNATLLSEPFQILGDITPKEYGIIRAIIHREFTEMRVSKGFPVWYCIPKMHGTPAETIDPDTGHISGTECGALDPAVRSYGLRFQGGFYPPVLTWIRVRGLNTSLQDDPEAFSPSETNQLTARLLPFPKPQRGHMIVDPATDRRYLVSAEIKPNYFRGVVPTTFDATLDFLSQGDERYQFEVPFIDTKAYRRIPYWNPGTVT